MRKLSCSGKLSNYVMCCVHWRNINVPLVYTFSFRVNVIAKKKNIEVCCNSHSDNSFVAFKRKYCIKSNLNQIKN